MQSVFGEFRRWYSGQERGCRREGSDVLVRRGSEGERREEEEEEERETGVKDVLVRRGCKGERSDEEEERETRVKDVIKRFDNIHSTKTGFISEEVSKRERVTGFNTHSETQLMRTNDMSSDKEFEPYGRREGNINKGLEPLDSTNEEYTAIHTPAHNNSGAKQNNITRENHEILDSKGKFWKSKGKTEKGQHTVSSQPQTINNNKSDCYSPEGLLSRSGTLSGSGSAPDIDTQAPGRMPLRDKHTEQFIESREPLNLEENRHHRSFSFSQRLLTTTTTTTTTTATAKVKSLPTKLNPKDYSEKTILGWKKERLLSALSRAIGKRSQDPPLTSPDSTPSCPSTVPSSCYVSAPTSPVASSPTSVPSSPCYVPVFPSSVTASPTTPSSISSSIPDSSSSIRDLSSSIRDSSSSVRNSSSIRDSSSSVTDFSSSPDSSRSKVVSRLSVRTVGNSILYTVAQLFGHFLSKPASSKTPLLTKTPSEDRLHKEAQETTRDTVMLRKPLTKLGLDCNQFEDFYSLDERTGEVLFSKGVHRKMYVHQEAKSHDGTSDGVPRDEELAKGTNRVRDIVRMIEDKKTKGDTDATQEDDEEIRRLRDEAIKNMTLPLDITTDCNDNAKQRTENEPVEEETSKKGGGGGDQGETNTRIPQSPMSEMKENGAQSEETDNETKWRLLTSHFGSVRNRRRGSRKEERGRGNKEEGGRESNNKEGDKRRRGSMKEKADTVFTIDNEDTESETDDESVTLRSKPRNMAVSFYRYSTLGPRGRQGLNPHQPFSVVRPRTVIIGLGVCTEAKYINDSFGDGVSETESEDEEDISPAPVPAPAPTPTRQRPTTPSRISRPHSPYSDMDTESKRNSQAVSTEPSDLEDHSSVTTSDLDCPEAPIVDSRKDKAYRIALELLHTERTYVKVLHLIDQEFQFRVDNENRAHHMFPHDVILHMFSNIKSIYKLHHDFLLPQLEERMAQWELNRRIGDIMKNFAPFLKMYTEYVRNFDNAMTLINQWQAKCPRFATIMDDIHSMEVCGSLTLQHHMLSPVQRIPRYEMLLRDYLKKLPEDSPDCHDTEKALHLVSTAANHANDAMKKIDKFEKLLEIQESLGGAEDLVSPTRELIKEGKIIKISARSGDHQERYIFLLTDLLLLCSPRLMSGRVMSGPQYRLRAKYHVENLIIQEGDNLETANTFYIKDSNKSVELYTQTIEEKEQWLDAFIRAIHETSQRKSSLKLHFNPNQRVMDVDLGQKQPMLIRSDSVTKCMECGSQFTMVRRKHHCRACGAVVCSKCSSFKASLAYECGKSVRVCRTCHATLQELSSSTATPSPEIDEGDECSVYSAKDQLDLPFRNRGVLEVSAKTSGAVMQGFLQLKTHRKTWVKRWFALHTDFVLYSFKCEADDQALTATPVPGFTVTNLQGTRNESGISDKEKERAFKLHHAKKQYIFQAASKDESQRWVASLKKASQAELPSPVQ